MSNLEINHELVANTCNVTEIECNNLGFFTFHDYSNDEYNRRFLVSEILEKCKDSNCALLNKNLLALAKLANDYGCKWLLLDADGPVIKSHNINVFEW